MKPLLILASKEQLMILRACWFLLLTLLTLQTAIGDDASAGAKEHRLVERQLTHFGNREAERVCIVPTELNLDVTDGYPENNGVHPNAAGYQQIGASIYCWLKSRLAE